MSDLYQVLGVPSTAELEDIKRNYRRLVRKYHPDINPSPQAAQTFKSVSQAYSILSDPSQRALYDQFGARMLEPGFDPATASGWSVRPPDNGEAENPFGDMSAFRDVWNTILNGELPEEDEEAQAPADLEVEAQIDAYTAARGGVTQISFRTPTGRVRQVRVRVRPGAQDGEVVRLPGMAGGHGVPGDLLVTLRMPRAHTPGARGAPWARPPGAREAYHQGAASHRPHTARASGHARPEYHAPPRREPTSQPPRGSSTPEDGVMELEVPVTVMEAIRGGVVEIQTPIGSRKVNLPPGCGGRTLRIRTRSRTGQVADTTFVLKLQVVLPTQLDAEALQALEILERAYRRPLPR